MLLNVWATWCVPCRTEMPSIQALHDRFAARGLKVVAVSVDNAGFEDEIQRFRDQYGLTFEILHDASGQDQTGLPDDGRSGDVRHRARRRHPQEGHRRRQLGFAGESRAVRASCSASPSRLAVTVSTQRCDAVPIGAARRCPCGSRRPNAGPRRRALGDRASRCNGGSRPRSRSGSAYKACGAVLRGRAVARRERGGAVGGTRCRCDSRRRSTRRGCSRARGR